VILDGGFWASVGGPGGAAPSERVNSVVLAIEVADVDADYRRLAAAGVAFEIAPTARPRMGLRNVLRRVPDGRLVELTTRLTPKPKPA
jgi:hypothetical protein